MKMIRGLLMLASTVVLAGACGPGTVTVRDHRPPPPPVDPGPPPTPDPGDAFDSTGWTSLGMKMVDGKVDRDVIPVSRADGLFDKIAIVVTDSDLELLDFVITFGNGSRFEPKIRHNFKEGTRSRIIDLPGNNRVINGIELAYANIPGGGRARVEVFAKDTQNRPAPTEPPPPPPPPAEPPFDAAGWTLLGTQTVDGKRDTDVINVPKKIGKADVFTIVVKDSDLTLEDIVVTFGNKQTWSPAVRFVFAEGTRSRVIDLPLENRLIKKVQLKYGNLPGGGKATVEIWAKDRKANNKK
jgi:hypothetical protein